MAKQYNSFVKMKYPGDNLLTRIIDAVKQHKLGIFSPSDVCELLSEGGETPLQTVKSCITCNTQGYKLLEEEGKAPHFLRVERGVYTLASASE